jgi:ferrous iron transport protein A
MPKRRFTMPLSQSEYGRAAEVRRIDGSDEVKKHLEAMGFIIGTTVTVISELAGSLIVKVKESRVAMNCDLAGMIFVAD